MKRFWLFIAVEILKRTRWRYIGYTRLNAAHNVGVFWTMVRSPSVYDPAQCAEAFGNFHVGPHQFQFLKQYPIELIPEPETQVNKSVYRR